MDSESGWQAVPAGVRMDEVVAPPAPLRQFAALFASRQQSQTAADRFGLARLLPAEPVLFGVLGLAGSGRTLIARALAQTENRLLWRLNWPALAGCADPDRAAIALVRSARTASALALLDADAAPALGPAAEAAVGRLLRDMGGDVIVLAPASVAPPAWLRRAVVHWLHLPQPDRDQRQLLWETHLPAAMPLAADVDPAALAAQFALNGGAIARSAAAALAAAVARDPEAPQIWQADLLAAATAQAGGRTSEAHPAGRRGLDRMVVPADLAAELALVRDACRHHAAVLGHWGFAEAMAGRKALVVLIDGPHGTGKSLCLRALAEALAVPLAEPDWRAFAIRGTGAFATVPHGALVHIDDAEAVLGRRTDAAASGDRDAAWQVRQFLGDLDGFAGIVAIAATTIGNLDAAVLRRVQYRVTLREPDALQREGLLRSLLPAGLPADPAIDFAALARDYELNGAGLHNAVIRAARAAAAHGADRLKHDHLAAACAYEAQAAGKVVWSQAGRKPGAETQRP